LVGLYVPFLRRFKKKNNKVTKKKENTPKETRVIAISPDKFHCFFPAVYSFLNGVDRSIKPENKWKQVKV
jgi:hypothetical protein